MASQWFCGGGGGGAGERPGGRVGRVRVVGRTRVRGRPALLATPLTTTQLARGRPEGVPFREDRRRARPGRRGGARQGRGARRR